MDGLKHITAPRGALGRYNSPELTSIKRMVAQHQRANTKQPTLGKAVINDVIINLGCGETASWSDDDQ